MLVRLVISLFLAQDPLGPALAALHAGIGNSGITALVSIIQIKVVSDALHQIANRVAVQQVVSDHAAGSTSFVSGPLLLPQAPALPVVMARLDQPAAFATSVALSGPPGDFLKDCRGLKIAAVTHLLLAQLDRTNNLGLRRSLCRNAPDRDGAFRSI